MISGSSEPPSKKPPHRPGIDCDSYWRIYEEWEPQPRKLLEFLLDIIIAKRDHFCTKCHRLRNKFTRVQITICSECHDTRKSWTFDLATEHPKYLHEHKYKCPRCGDEKFERLP